MSTRATNVTVGLILLGALGGAICGMLNVLPLATEQAFRPTLDSWELGRARDWLPVAAGIGAVLGAVLGPTLGWGLLRAAPLWRVVLQPIAGTIVGSALGWVIARASLFPGLIGGTAFIWVGMAGAIIAAVLLRIQTRRIGSLAKKTSA